MKKIKIGVLGLYRGSSMIDFCHKSDDVELVAICDKWEEGVERKKQQLNDNTITFYTSFDEFIQHDMDAVVLANYANEHAPFAIRCLEKGMHVFSEVLPVQNMQEAVKLVEAVESSGKVYAYGENYCYMPALREMRNLYKEGKIGDFEYGEGEYIHNCAPIWPSLTYGDPDHWRNNMCSTFYCTHSLGPIIHITGLRPVSVIGIESTKNARNLAIGSKSGQFGIELVTLENGGIVKSIHGGLYRDSVWYTLYGSMGRLESSRWVQGPRGTETIHTDLDEYPDQNRRTRDCMESYQPASKYSAEEAAFGHGGSDFHSMFNFIKKIHGDPDADTIDVYEALDMFLPGLFAYRSILAGNIPMEIPNLRDKAVRDQYRNDTACTDPKVAADQLQPTCSLGTPVIDGKVYAAAKQRWAEEFTTGDGRSAQYLGSPKKNED